MSDTVTEPRSELEQPIWAISWPSGSWPRGNGVKYAEAEMARQTAERNYPADEFTIVTYEAAQRQKQTYLFDGIYILNYSVVK